MGFLSSEQPPESTSIELSDYLTRMLTQIRISLSQIITKVVIAYGGLRLSAPTAFNDLSAAWQKLTVFDEVVFETPIRVQQNLADDTLTFNKAGIFTVTVNMSMSHDEAQAGRVTYIRVYSQTLGVGSSEIYVATGRNTIGTNMFISSLVLVVKPEHVGHTFEVQIGNGDIYLDVIIHTASFTATSIGGIFE